MVEKKSCVPGRLNFLERVEVAKMHLQAMLVVLRSIWESMLYVPVEIIEFLKEG